MSSLSLQQVCTALRSSEALQSVDLDIEIDSPQFVSVTRRGHLVGIWRLRQGKLEWLPAGYATCQYAAGSTSEAVALMELHFTRVVMQLQ
ncbi:MAG: hypothetical protein APF80_10020 [Alphaproteobacteria bacterium BRH_c36]|nr:MAG: hypothetical protein APF80_10020 [Alphaproteobacteria bacterium BRH_c36]